MKQTNKQELQPFLAIDYRLLALDVKIEMNGKAINEATILKSKLIYAYLLGLSKNCDEVYPEQETIGEKLSIGSRQVAGRCIAILEALGWIKKVKRKGTSNLYMVKSLDEILAGPQMLNEVKEEIIAPSNVHIEEPEPLETDFEDINERKSSFAEELDFYNSLPIKDTLPQKEVVPAEPKTYPWGSSKVFQSNGRIDQLVWDWALRESNQNESSALSLMIKTTSFNLTRDNIPGFSIAEDEYTLPF